MHSDKYFLLARPILCIGKVFAGVSIYQSISIYEDRQYNSMTLVLDQMRVVKHFFQVLQVFAPLSSH